MIESITKTLEELHIQANALNRKMTLLREARTKLMLGWSRSVVMAELHAAGVYEDLIWEETSR